MATPNPLTLLTTIFGYAAFRGQQAEIIDHVIAGGDTLVLMPTGGGKSLCYQIPALARPGIGIVISPLIALMKNQVDALNQAGVRAAFINSSLPPGEAREIEEQARSGAIDMLYVAPERLVTPYFLDLLGKLRIALFAIDEAHCVSQWGHDFRPEYRALHVLHERFPQVPRIALTATADIQTRADIIDRLQLAHAPVFIAGFDRPNIAYHIIPKKEPRPQLLRFIKTDHAGEAGIVYCMSRRKVDEIAAFLQLEGIQAYAYHAGLEPALRQKHQDLFLREEGVVIVATIAFGMGIDKPNVRFVAHLDVPRSLEAYYQETGRAGRDGLPAVAWMLYGLADVLQVKQMLQGSDLPDKQKRVEAQKLDALLGYCETADCRRRVLLTYFGEQPPEACGNCDTCLNPIKRWDATIAGQKALSAVFRTGQRFGVQHLIDVLTAVATERVKKLAHDQLKTFGVGTDLSRSIWQSVFRQLVAGGYLAVDVEGHGGLRLGEDAPQILRGEKKLELREDPAPEPSLASGRDRGSGARSGGKITAEEEQLRREPLWATLRALRLEISKEQGVPPYVIFHDTTLLEMVARQPRQLAALALIPGVGKSKLDRYGTRFCKAISGFDEDVS